MMSYSKYKNYFWKYLLYDTNLKYFIELHEIFGVEFNTGKYSTIEEFHNKYIKKDKNSEKIKLPISISSEMKSMIDLLLVFYINELESLWDYLSEFESKKEIIDALISDFDYYIEESGLDHYIFYPIFLYTKNVSPNIENSPNFDEIKNIIRHLLEDYSGNIYITECFAYQMAIFITTLMKNTATQKYFKKFKHVNSNIFQSELFSLLKSCSSTEAEYKMIHFLYNQITACCLTDKEKKRESTDE